MRRLLRLVRSQDWWFYKIPPILAAGYSTALVYGVAGRDMLVTLGAVFASICMVACFGYVVNDLFDIEQDRRAGKRNMMAGLGGSARALAVVLPVAAGVAILLASNARPQTLALLALNFALPAMYSIPPLRLKERGLLGVLADAGAAHLMPTAMVVTALVPAGSGTGAFTWLFLGTACGWAFLSGFRGIIVHQVGDRRADQLAAVATFGGQLGPQRARALTFGILLPIEVASLLGFLALVIPFAPAVAAFSAAYVLCEIQKVRLQWKLPMFQIPSEAAERYVPLINNEFYELWLPLSLALQLAIVDRRLVPVLLFQIVAFLPNLVTRAAGIGHLVLRAPVTGRR